MRKYINFTALTAVAATVAYFSLNTTGFFGLPSPPYSTSPDTSY